MTPAKPVYTYEIRVEGHIPADWLDWFDGLEVISRDEETRLVGSLPDNPALLGVLAHLASLNLALISVARKSILSQGKK